MDENNKADGTIQLDDRAAGILRLLLREQRAAEENIAYFIGQCAAAKQIRLEEYDVQLKTMTFIPKPPQPKVIVQ